MTSLRPKYYQVGVDNEHALYPVVPEEDRKLPWTFDNLNVEEVNAEVAEEEAAEEAEEELA